MHIYMYTYIHTYMQTCKHTYTHIQTYTHTYIYIYIHTYIHTHTHIHTHLQKASTYGEMAARTAVGADAAFGRYVCMYVCMCVCMHLHTSGIKMDVCGQKARMHADKDLSVFSYISIHNHRHRTHLLSISAGEYNH